MATANEMARNRLEASWDKMVKIQAREIPANDLKSEHEAFLAEQRRKNVIANRKYRQTEKGRMNNRLQCKRYFQNHREQCQGYVLKYKEAFKAKYGVLFTAWNYWRKKLVAGKCTEDELPPQYALILADWKAKHERCTDEH